MHNTYISSTISVRCKGSVSISFNDYPCFLDDRFFRNSISLSPSSCCTCCANAICRVPINPTFLYGLRQSTLIQWSPCRRLVWDGGNQCCSRLPVCDVNSNINYGKSYTSKERSINGRSGKWGKRRYGCNAEDAEVMLSLLTEVVGGDEECFGFREKYGRATRRVQLEKRENAGGSRHKGKKHDVGSGNLVDTSSSVHESVKFQAREEGRRHEDNRREEKRENFMRSENNGARRTGSSCSSYYSLSSSGELESDSEVQVNHHGVKEESSSAYERNHGEIRHDGETLEEVDGLRDRGYAEERGVVLRKENTVKGLNKASSAVESDWRKKSEKKLNEVWVEETESRKESSQKNLRLSELHEGGYGKSSNSQDLMQYDAKKETSTLTDGINRGTRKRYSQTGQRVREQSELSVKHQQFTEMPEIHDSAIKTTSSSQKQYEGMEKKLLGSVSFVRETAGEQLKTDDLINGQEKHRRTSQQLARVSEIREIDNRETSISRSWSETRMKNQEDNASIIVGLVDDLEERQNHTSQGVSRQIDSRGKFQHLIGISDYQTSKIDSTTISQNKSDTGIKKQEESSDEASISHSKAPEQQFPNNSESIRTFESRKNSQGISNNNDAEKVTGSNIASEKRTSSQERYSSTVVKVVEENRKVYNLIDETILRIGSRKEAQRPTKVLSFHEGVSEEPPSSLAPLKFDSQSMGRHVGVGEDTRSLQATVRSQLHDFHIENLGGGSSTSSHVNTLDVSPALQHEAYGGVRRSETREEPVNLAAHEDLLGSAAQLQKKSTQFFGEFVEKLRHEVSTSEVQKESKTNETKFVQEGKLHEQKGPGQYSSGDSQPKDHDSRRSSQGSGTKGPSDEIWDVTDPSVEEPLKTEAPEATTAAGNDVVKRTSRSMWSIISDIVRFRWASRSETNNSRSGGRSSPNQSVSSEAWFSGHEPDENNDDNVKKQKANVLKESSSVDQKQQKQSGGINVQSQGEVSSSKRSKDKILHSEVGSLSSSNTESGSPSQGILLPTFEEDGAMHSEGTSSGTVAAESLIPLPTIRMRRSPGVQETSEARQADAFGSDTVVPIEQPVATSLSEVSGTEDKNGGMKQRKLQRNKQVLKDKFDEWEEAYILESDQRKTDEFFMREALIEAKKAADIWEVPVGAVLVQHGKIIARGYNLVEELRDSTAHAEMICIREASNILRTWRLSETTLYVTLEPCPMCAGAILQARIDTIVWGAPNKLLGADGSWIRLFPNGGEGQNGSETSDKPAAPVHPFHPNLRIRRGILASECADVMQQFFRLRRKKDKKPDPPTPPSCLPISNHPSKFLTKMHDVFRIMFCL